MSDTNAVRQTKQSRRIRHRGRTSQVSIYLGKQLRFFINENDWKVLPMAAIIAALVGMVIRKRLFINMEGSLIGGFALTCVAIWNGCFNSIQAVCRERPIIKREHRSGMHVTSYVAAHMIYQFLLCLAQTGLTMYVLLIMEIQFPAEGFITPWMIVDIGISMLLISYAADMMSLFISSISHTTTGAMTIMPFVLIFQLVFSGGVIPLPAWSQALSDYTISSYGIKVIAAQSGYNERPMVTAWNTIEGMKDRELGGTFTIGDVLDFLQTPGVEKYRGVEVSPAVSSADVMNELIRAAGQQGIVLDQAVSQTLVAMAAENDKDAPAEPLRLGDLIDWAVSSDILRENRDQSVTVRMTIGQLFDLFGEERIRTAVQTTTAAASYKPEYDLNLANVMDNWLMLGVFILLFALLSTLALELIDRDKR